MTFTTCDYQIRLGTPPYLLHPFPTFRSHLNAKSIKKKSERISQPQIQIKTQGTCK